MLLLSGATHYVRDETISENLDWHQVRFLQRHLGVTPREPATAPARPATPAVSL